MKYLFLALISSMTLLSYAQVKKNAAPEVSNKKSSLPFKVEWEQHLVNPGGGELKSIVAAPNGGYLAVGSTQGEGGDWADTKPRGKEDWIIIRFSANKEVEWKHRLGSSGNDKAMSAANTPDGGFVVAGYVEENNGDVTGRHGMYPEQADVWVVKLDSKGNIQWKKTYGGSLTDQAYSIAATPDNGYIITGYTASNDGDVKGNHTKGDMWVAKIAGDGTLQWQKALGGDNYDQGHCVAVDTDGGYIVTGYTTSKNGDVTNRPGGTSDLWIIKLTKQGNIQWQKTIGGSETDEGTKVVVTKDGRIIVAGETTSKDGDITNAKDSWDIFLACFNSKGEMQWKKVVGGNSFDRPTDMLIDPTGNIILTGITYSNDSDMYEIGYSNDAKGDIFLFTLSAKGEIIAKQIISLPDENLITSIIMTPTGLIGGGSPYGQDWWIYKFNNSPQ